MYIDYEKGLVLGEQLKVESIKLNELLNKLDNIQSNINNEKLNNLQNDLKVIIKLSEIVDKTSNFLINVSNAYKEVDIACSQGDDKFE